MTQSWSTCFQYIYIYTDVFVCLMLNGKGYAQWHAQTCNPVERWRSKLLHWWFNIYFGPSHPMLDIYSPDLPAWNFKPCQFWALSSQLGLKLWVGSLASHERLRAIIYLEEVQWSEKPLMKSIFQRMDAHHQTSWLLWRRLSFLAIFILAIDKYSVRNGIVAVCLDGVLNCLKASNDVVMSRGQAWKIKRVYNHTHVWLSKNIHVFQELLRKLSLETTHLSQQGHR